jgi:hypothetical protein
MWIVRLALNRPYTFVVLSLLIVILSAVAIVRTPVDIFPEIDIPVVGVLLNYSGLAPQDMQDRLATVLERNLTTTVNDIEHMEAQSYHGLSIVKIFFQPGTDPFAGMAQISASSQSAVRNMPPGTVPPFMIAYSAADVPILQLGLSSKRLSELQLQDLASNFLRTQLATVQGAELPGAYGGKSRRKGGAMPDARRQRDSRASFIAFTGDSKKDSTGFETGTGTRSNGVCTSVCCAAVCSWRSAPAPWRSSRCSAPTCFPSWTPDRFACTGARRPAPAWKRRRPCATGWNSRCAGRSPRTTSGESPITSGSPTAGST